MLRGSIRTLFVNFDFPVCMLIVIEAMPRAADGGKAKFYCEMDDNTDYCPHTAFAAALPQVRNAIRR